MNDDELKKHTQDDFEAPSLPSESEDGGIGRYEGSPEGLSNEPVQTHDGQDESQNETDDSADDDRFAELRRNLKEYDEAEKEKKQKSIVRRITSRLKKLKTGSLRQPVGDGSTSGDTTTSIASDSDSPSDEKIAALLAPAEQSEPEPVEDDLETLSPDQDVEDFILNLEPSDAATKAVHEEIVDEPIKPDKPQPHREPDDDKRFESMRETALEDYGEELETAETQTKTFPQRLRIFRKGLKPVEKVLFAGAFVFFVVICLFMLGTLIYPRVSESEPPTPVPTQDLPYPIRVKLTGAGYFDLKRGKVENGRWNMENKDNGSGEWLEGTELCKWVAIPWSVQLEAVVRSLTQNDFIELTMSNADILTYKVFSIQNVPVDRIETLEGSGTCLLLILANEDADSRWVVTALP